MIVQNRVQRSENGKKPLNFIDSDGPGDQKYNNLNRIEHRAKYLGLNIEANTHHFLRLKDFRFFPGSLGNYAGKERNIPTYTVEFQTPDTSKAHYYRDAIRFALVKALSFTICDEENSNHVLRIQHVLEPDNPINKEENLM